LSHAVNASQCVLKEYYCQHLSIKLYNYISQLLFVVLFVHVLTKDKLFFELIVDIAALNMKFIIIIFSFLFRSWLGRFIKICLHSA